MNRVEISGGLVRPPELRYTQGGWPFATFTIAVAGTRWDSKKKERVITTAFIACEVSGPRAEQIAEELDGKKGEEIYVLGELDQNEWIDDKGNKQSKTRVRVMQWIRLTPKDDRPRTKEWYDEDDPDQAPF